MDEIKGDFQLAGLGPLLKNILKDKKKPLIIDLGCGNGILLYKLLELEIIKDHPNISYLGFDKPYQLEKAMKSVNELKIHRHTQLLTLDDSWYDYITNETIVIIRNVFHELSITEAAEIIFKIAENLKTGASVIIQDITTLPVAEKGRTGWIGTHIHEIFLKCGMDVIFTPDVSKHGVNVFLIHGKQNKKNTVALKDIKLMLIEKRKEQLAILRCDYKNTKEKQGNELKFSRLNHDITAICIELIELDSLVESDELTDTKTIVEESVTLPFFSLTNDRINFLITNYKPQDIKLFQDRSRALRMYEEFFISESPILYLWGPSFIGKRHLTLQVIHRKLIERLPLFIKLDDTSDIFIFLEKMIEQLGLERFFDAKLLSSVRELPTDNLHELIQVIIDRIAKKVLLIVDGFEDILNPDNTLNNGDIEWLITTWAAASKAKIIIESRYRANDEFMNSCMDLHIMHFNSKENGLYGHYLYTVQLLQDLVPYQYKIPETEYGGFPIELIESLDNHPYFITIAGNIIANNPDSACLKDEEFIQQLKRRLFSTLINEFNINKNEQEILIGLSFIKDEFPIRLLDIIVSDNETVKQLITKGLLILSYPGMYRLIGILKDIQYSIHLDEGSENLIQMWNEKLSRSYLQLYNETNNPSYFRSSYYHSALSGMTKQFTYYNIPELLNCAEMWVKRHDYEDALWAFEKIKKYRKLTPRQRMRYASVLIRTGNIEAGQVIYESLIKEDKKWNGVKYSYAVSLLHIRKNIRYALTILHRIPEKHRDSYWNWQVAKCYRRLSEPLAAYKHYETAIIEAYYDKVWDIIHDFIIYARNFGDDETIKDWLVDFAWKKLKIRSDDIKIDLGGYYERIGKFEDAIGLLHEVYPRKKHNAYCVLPLIKALCRMTRYEECKRILDDVGNTAQPENVLAYAHVYYKQSNGDFEGASELLEKRMHTDNKYPIHNWGQWTDLYLTWSSSVIYSKQKEIALKGLRYVNEIIKERNVPAMKSCLSLAKIAQDKELEEKIKVLIQEVTNFL